MSDALDTINFERVPALTLEDWSGEPSINIRAQKIRVGTNDLAIAAIALSVNAVMVTRNIVDFQRVPHLIIEDWTH